MEFKSKPERFRQLADSLHQFTPIKRNKFIDRKRWMITEKETYVCACQNQSRKKNKLTNPECSFDCGERCINKCVSTE